MSNLTGMTRRELLARCGLSTMGVALAGTLGACSSGPPAAGQPAADNRPAGSQPATPVGSFSAEPAASSRTSAPAAPTAAENPRIGGTLRYGLIGDYPVLDGQAPNSFTVDNLWGVWDRLAFYDTKMQPQPMLAESWEISSDYTQIKFNLRKGVQFHTGRELGADDVKWCLERLQDPKIGSSLTARARVITAVDTPDRYTVVVKASRPWLEAFDFFEFVNIIDPVTFMNVGVSKPTGTGPFAFSEYVQGDHLRMVKNTNYWRRERPYLDEVLVSIKRDAQSAVVQLEAGAIDLIVYGLPVNDAVRLQNDPAYQVLVNANTGAFWVVAANCTQPPTDNKLVRQALNYALDRKRIADTVWHGLAKAQALPWAPTSPAYDASKNEAYKFDLNKAKSLLDQSGLSNIHLELDWTTSTSDFATVAQVYQADLTKIGVDVVLKPLEPAVYNSVRANHTYGGLSIGPGLYGQLQPSTTILGPYYGPDINTAGFKDDVYTQLVNKVVTETDSAKRRSLYSELNDYLLDQSWQFPMVQSPARLAARANVRGLRFDQHEALVISDVWLA